MKDHLIISKVNPDSEVSIFDVTGKLLLKQQITGSGELKMDLRSLKQGVYLLKCQDKEFIKSSLIYKE